MATVRSDRRRVLRAAGLLVACSSTAVAQQAVTVRVLFDSSSPSAGDLVLALRSKFGQVVAVTDVRQLLAPSAPNLYVAIGADALAGAVNERLNAPLVALLVSRQAFERITVGRTGAVTGVYAEPAPRHQMHLIRAIFQRRVTVGVLLSPALSAMADLLRDAAAAHDLALHVEAAEPGVALSRNLLRLADATAILTFPDADLYTAQSLRELLETTYRRRQPVIGFSAALVAAGTLASAYARADDLAAHLADITAQIAQRRLPPTAYPRYWRVAVNENVARSLNVIVGAGVLQMGDRP